MEQQEQQKQGEREIDERHKHRTNEAESDEITIGNKITNEKANERPATLFKLIFDKHKTHWIHNKLCAYMVHVQKTMKENRKTQKQKSKNKIKTETKIKRKKFIMQSEQFHLSCSEINAVHDF